MDDDDDVPPLEATRSRIESDRNHSSLAALWSLSAKTGWFVGDVFFGRFCVFCWWW